VRRHPKTVAVVVLAAFAAGVVMSREDSQLVADRLTMPEPSPVEQHGGNPIPYWPGSSIPDIHDMTKYLKWQEQMLNWMSAFVDLARPHTTTPQVANIVKVLDSKIREASQRHSATVQASYALDEVNSQLDAVTMRGESLSDHPEIQQLIDRSVAPFEDAVDGFNKSFMDFYNQARAVNRLVPEL
jgi:hypothetical protein